MLVVATFGVIGAFKESTMLTNIVSVKANRRTQTNKILISIFFLYSQYACLLSLVFVLEISAAIAGFVLQSQVREMLVRTMNESIAAYTKYETATTAVDFMQRSVSFCFNTLNGYVQTYLHTA